LHHQRRADSNPRRFTSELKLDPNQYHHYMALRATISKAELKIADMERGYYKDHTLTIARHPSETE
jgi:hypothetical protein